jgi:BirA family biotin operon repressor/biotin-[acetyl-CoA-carboxylase] ligase
VAKLGGILTEMVCAGGAIDFVVIGLGCNVNTSAFPPELAATSLRQVSGLSSPLDLHQLAQRLLGELDDGYRRYLELGPSPLLCAFAEAARLGDAHPEVTVTTPQKTLRGVPIGLGSEGELLLRIPSGQIERVLSGDVAMSVAVQ